MNEKSLKVGSDVLLCGVSDVEDDVCGNPLERDTFGEDEVDARQSEDLTDDHRVGSDVVRERRHRSILAKAKLDTKVGSYRSKRRGGGD